MIHSNGIQNIETKSGAFAMIEKRYNERTANVYAVIVDGQFPQGERIASAINSIELEEKINKWAAAN